MLKNDLLLRAARRERTERTPVWLMRQAGRFDPKYRELRERTPLALEDLFRDPDLATEISLLPKRLGVDAIIFFQDILTPLAPMGAGFVFRPGPVLESPIRTAQDVSALKRIDPSKELDFAATTLRMIKSALAGEMLLVGFAGAPLTLAFFLIEGGSPDADSPKARALMREDPKLFHTLLDLLADMTADYLAMQIEAGADVVQLFESCANLVSRSEYEQFAHPYHVKILSRIAGSVPTILFVKDQPFVDLMASSGADVVSIGARVDLAQAKRKVGHQVAIQGNVDHELMVNGSLPEIEQAVRSCVHAGGHEGHILNLGNGLHKDTPFGNVCRFIETAKSIVATSASQEAATG
jgi:uroporphyrinogen decarboxylase